MAVGGSMAYAESRPCGESAKVNYRSAMKRILGCRPSFLGLSKLPRPPKPQDLMQQSLKEKVSDL